MTTATRFLQLYETAWPHGPVWGVTWAMHTWYFRSRAAAEAFAAQFQPKPASEWVK